MSIQSPISTEPEVSLVLQATFVFPQRPYLDPLAVQAARRAWVKAQLYLLSRNRSWVFGGGL